MAKQKQYIAILQDRSGQIEYIAQDNNNNILLFNSQAEMDFVMCDYPHKFTAHEVVNLHPTERKRFNAKQRKETWDKA